MPKHILYCADGTWNGPGDQSDASDIDSAPATQPPLEQSSDAVTNVVKLFANLAGQVTPETVALRDEQEKQLVDATGVPLQIAKYMHGVGDSSNVINHILGGVFGMGVIARIVRGYTFISRNYAPGDAIHIVGFSRGAYTARALAGMIARVGLLNRATYDPSDRAEAYRRGYEAWVRSKQVSFLGNGMLARALNRFLGFVAGVFGRATLKSVDLIADVRMKSVAVWDTVGSMGIPAYIQGQRRDLFSFVDLKLSPLIDRGFHAMALDEQRRDFPVTRWNADPARIEQVWFIGCHSDVGGGFPRAESGLSDIALQWMMERIRNLGVTFAQPPIYVPAPDLTQSIHQPWTQSLLGVGAEQRTPLAGDVYHPTVPQRWQTLVAYQKLWPAGFDGCALCDEKTALA
jgi:uncharacterized protein (DUF2235 family)